MLRELITAVETFLETTWTLDHLDHIRFLSMFLLGFLIQSGPGGNSIHLDQR